MELDWLTIEGNSPPMTKEEAFDLIERRRWAVSPQCGGGWVIDGGPSPDISGDADVWEIARTRGSLVTACKMAKAREDAGNPIQVKWRDSAVSVVLRARARPLTMAKTLAGLLKVPVQMWLLRDDVKYLVYETSTN